MVRQNKVGISGDKQLLKAFRKINIEMRDKVAPAAMRGLLRVVTKQVKKEIPAKYKIARKLVNHRFVKRDKVTKATVAKTGFKVGMTGKRVATLRKNKAYMKATFRNTAGRGVGLSLETLHWFIFGTQQRFNKSVGNRATGKMPALLENTVAKGWAASKPAALAKFKELARKELKRQIAKQKAKAKAKAK